MLYNETAVFSEPISRLCPIVAFEICKNTIELQMDITNNIKTFIKESCQNFDNHIDKPHYRSLWEQLIQVLLHIEIKKKDSA